MTLTLTPDMKLFLEISSGICWTLVYLLIIKRGFQDKTYGMPMWALAANISWEFLFSLVVLTHNSTQHIIDIIWCLFDFVIVFQFLRYGRPSFQGTVLERLFYPMAALALVVSFGAVATMTVGIEGSLPSQVVNGRYAAFAQNLMMSILFVSMLINRNSLSGQSLYIGIFKLVGTLLASTMFYLMSQTDIFLNFLFVAILVFDLLYVIMVYAKCRELKINPWTRF